MSPRDTVRAAQRKLALLDTAHARAVARLAQTVALRAKVLGEQDRLIKAAEAEVERTVADMVAAVGPELTANLLEVDPADVRRALRTVMTKQKDAAGH
jgi:predicted SpoU family rRNA methylase